MLCFNIKHMRCREATKRIIIRLVDLYWRVCTSPESYAKHLGVKIGEDCFISTRLWSSEPYLITIGNHVQITEGVSIHTHGGANAVRQQIPDFDCFGKVIIEDWAYIGAYLHIMPGVTIGTGSIVAAGSVVTKSVPPKMVVGGNPAKVIGSVEDYLQRNIIFNVHSRAMEYNNKKKFLLELPDEKFIKK